MSPTSVLHGAIILSLWSHYHLVEGTETADQNCDDSTWTLQNDYCYRLFSTAQIFSVAEYNCRLYGSHLVFITSAAENAFIQNMVSSTSLANGVLLP